MRTLSLAASVVCALTGCQRGERSSSAIAPRSESEKAELAKSAKPANTFDPWAPRDLTSSLRWPDTFKTAASEPAQPSAVEWKPGETITFDVASEPVAAASSGAVVSALTSTLSVIAMPEDASAAVTVDFNGSARLWPTLDGTREPVVIALHAPKQIAVTRDDDELVVATIDHAGQLELFQLAESGEPRGHRWIESPRPLTELWFAGQTLLAMRDDHVILGFDMRGAPRGELVSDPGEHIGTLAVRSGRALALLDAEGAVRGRWIDMSQPALQWGARTPPLPVLSGAVALTPDGKRIAGVNAVHRVVLIVDVGTGKIVRRALRIDDPDPRLRPTGFLSNRVLVMGRSFSSLEWSGRDYPDTTFKSSQGPVAIADGLAVGDDAGSLGLIGTSGPTHFLGYRSAMLQDVRSVDKHFIATDTTAVIELDEKFHTYLAQEMPVEEGGGNWYGITLLDKTHVVGNLYGKAENGLFIVDLTSKKATLIALRAVIFGYQPKTQLLEYMVENVAMVARFDPKTGTLGAPASLLFEPGSGKRLTLLDPAASSGNVAALTSMEDNNMLVHVTLIKSIDPARADQFERGASRDFRVDDEFWQTHTEADLVARMLPSPRQTSPDKQLTAELHDLRITLRDHDGNERWTVPSRGATTLFWTPDGDLVAYGSGIARVDLATGDMVDRQCGWRFGLWEESPQSFGGSEQCEAP